MARKQTFEAGMSELEALTERLAEGDMTLDETIKTYEKGVALAAQLNAPAVVSFEEAFTGRGGLDALVRGCLPPGTAFRAFGLPPRFEFAGTDRESTLRKYGLTVEGVAGELSVWLKEERR